MVTSVFECCYVTVVQSVFEIAIRYIGAESSQKQYLYRLIDGVVRVTWPVNES